MDYNLALENFNLFLEKFDKQSKEINIKISHTYHVVDLANKLAKSLELSQEETELVKIIALLHDLGRFIQYVEVGSYNDVKTKTDHAKLANNYLFNEGYIRDFIKTNQYDELIKKAIFNHNKYKIEKKLTKEERFYAKFIRDVDKIDIYRQNAARDNKYITGASPKVLKTLQKEELAKIFVTDNESDNLLFEFMYLFDINFKESYELLDSTDNLELYLSSVEVAKDKEQEFNEIKKILRKYLEKQLEG